MVAVAVAVAIAVAVPRTLQVDGLPFFFPPNQLWPGTYQGPDGDKMSWQRTRNCAVSQWLRRRMSGQQRFIIALLAGTDARSSPLSLAYAGHWERCDFDPMRLGRPLWKGRQGVQVTRKQD